jgi:hypothetical protein
MKNKYTKKNNRNKANNQERIQNVDTVEDNLVDIDLEEEILEEVVIEEIEQDEPVVEDSSMDDIDILSDELDEDMVSRLSLYDFVDDDDDDEHEEDEEDDEIKEFISRDFDVVAESRRRVNQPGRRKFDDEKKPKRERVAKEKKQKEPKPKKEKKVKDKDDASKTNFVKELWEKWIAIYSKNTMQILYGTLGTLAIILIITIIVLPKDSVKDADKTGKEVVTTGNKLSQESTEEESTEKQLTVADLKVETEDSEIHKLIVAFMDAERIKLDLESAKTYLDDATNYSLEKHKESKRYIEAYQNIKCYKFDYISDDMYYVYVSYDIKFVNINTPAANGEPFVVKYDKAQNKYLIHNIVEGEAGDLLIAWNAPEVKVLNEDVISRYNAALASDEVLKEFIGIMQGASNSTEETTTEVPTSANQ